MVEARRLRRPSVDGPASSSIRDDRRHRSPPDQYDPRPFRSGTAENALTAAAVAVTGALELLEHEYNEETVENI